MAERSVTFIPEEVDVQIGNAPVEGEWEQVEEVLEHAKKGNQPIPQPTEHETSNQEAPASAKPKVIIEESTSGRGKQIQKETAYIHQIREGKGSATGLKRVPAIPKGMQLAPEHPGELGETPTMVEDAEVEMAIASVMETAEFLNLTYEEAKRHSDWPKWEEAIKTKLTSLEKNGKWSMVECPQGANVMDCKWVLHIKKNAAGENEKYKARLVAQGFTQIYGVDYYETYTPVAQLASFQLLIAMANHSGWPLDSFDFDQLI